MEDTLEHEIEEVMGEMSSQPPVKRLRGAQLLLASITLLYVVLWLSYVVQDEPMKHIPLIV